LFGQVSSTAGTYGIIQEDKAIRAEGMTACGRDKGLATKFFQTYRTLGHKFFVFKKKNKTINGTDQAILIAQILAPVY
jgi:hypothetical protein